MIIRIFNASIPIEFHDEFEMKFKEISIPIVKKYIGLISLEIGRPTQWNPDEFIMISKWEKEDDLVNFAGEEWNQPHIPDGMERYIKHCSVSHFNHIDI